MVTRKIKALKEGDTEVFEHRMLEVRNAESTQIVFSADGTRMWVNINGVCLLRVYGVGNLDMDQRFEDITERREY